MSSPYRHALITGPPGVGKTTLVKKVCSVVRKCRGDVHMSGFYTEEVREGGRGGKGARLGFDVVTLEGERGVLARLAGQPVSGAGNSRSKNSPSVGRYHVDIASFEHVALPTLQNCSENRISATLSSCTAEPSSGEVGEQGAGCDTCDAAALLKTQVSAPHSVCRGGDRGQELTASASSQTTVIVRHVVVIDEIGKMELFSRSFIDAVRRNFEQKSKECVLVLATIPVAGYKIHWLVEELRHHTDCMLFQVTMKNRDRLVEEISQFLLQRLQ